MALKAHIGLLSRGMGPPQPDIFIFLFFVIFLVPRIGPL